MLISLTEYAKKIGRDTSTIRRKAQKGLINAKKIGNTWLIEDSEPYVDMRKKHKECK